VAAAALALFAAFCGLLVWVVLWLDRPGAVRVVVLAAGYEQNLGVPHNVYGRRWAEGLAAAASGGPTEGLLRGDPGGPAEFRARAAWDAGLRGVRGGTVVLAVAAHGGADADGAYLLPTDAGPGPAAANRLRLTAVLDRLAELPAKANKVLLLDAVQEPANPLFGMLSNEFAAELEKLDGRIAAVPNLVVLSSAGPGERSWAVEALGTTAFGHHLLAGLAGAADANGDRRVTAAELHRYVADRVREHVAAARGAAQTPVLYPRGPEGERRAAAVALNVRTLGPVPADPEPRTVVPPPALRSAWGRFRSLDARSPHPSAAAPHDWRVYAATLRRYEELLAAGDEKAAGEAAAKLPDLERRVTAGAGEFRSAGNSLALPAAVGVSVPPLGPAAERAFEDVWAAPPAQERRKLDEWLAAAAPDAAAARHHLYAQLLARATADPTRNLARSAALARRADDPGRPRPAEIHFLVALAENLPEKALPARAELVRTALDVRATAERAAVGAAAGHAERVYPWVADRVRAADADRATAEDLVFATADGDLAEAAAKFASAKAGYAAVLAVAGRVRAGFDARDRLFAALPTLAEWAADHTDPAVPTEVLALWQQAHALDARLRTPDPAADLDAPPLVARLAALVARVTRDVDELLPLPPAYVPPTVAAARLDRALRTAVLDADRRTRALATADRLARDRLKATAGDTPVSAESPAPARRGLLALAELGPTAFAAAGQPGRPGYDDLRASLAAAEGPDRPRILLAAGTEINDRLVRLPARARGAVEGAAFADPLAARAAAQTADRLARATPAALPLVPADVVARSRDHFVNEMLVGLAARVGDGAWAGGPDPAGEPYYRAAGRAFLDDLRRNPFEAARSAAAAARGRLAEPFEPVLTPAASVAVTEPTPFPVEVGVTTPRRAGLLPGRVLVWAEPSAGLAFGAATAGRVAVPAAGTQQVRVKLEVVANPDAVTPTAVAAGVTARGFFRGRDLRRGTPVEVYPLPDVTARFTPPPPGAAVAVRASREVTDRFGGGVGAVAVVLDSSGSMAAPAGRPAAEARVKQGARAVARLAAGLPRDTVLTVFAFGQSGDAGKKVEPAEQGISRLFGPARWDPDDAAAVAELTARLDALEPYNQSPLFRAALTAFAEVEPATGYRAVVLVTDGVDNRFDEDAELNPKKRPGLLVVEEKLRAGRVAGHVLGFPPHSPDESRAQIKLKVFAEGLPETSLYRTVDKPEEVAAALKTALSPRLYCRLAGTGGPDLPLPVGTGVGGDRWPDERVGPGRYRVVPEAPRAAAAPVTLRAGDNLLLSLAPVPGGGLAFRRRPFADDYPGRPSATAGDWRLGVLQNKLEKDGGLRMLAVLEPPDRPAGDGLEVARPADVWFEVGSDLETRFPPAVRWAPAWGYPAAVWAIDAPKWPPYTATGTAARPVLRAWWDPLRPARSSRDVALDELRTATAPRTLDVGPDRVTLDPLAPDARPPAPGDPPPSRPAVVVRLAHPPRRPVVARLDGVPLDGYEHRLFAAANRYTGVFWPAADADLSRATVRLVSLEEFKATAVRAVIRDLPPPDPNDDGPRPVEPAPPRPADGLRAAARR
jgi:hypothetical protein